jgi:RNA polymerase sigma factor (sigma-70 family)
MVVRREPPDLDRETRALLRARLVHADPSGPRLRDAGPEEGQARRARGAVRLAGPGTIVHVGREREQIESASARERARTDVARLVASSAEASDEVSDDQATSLAVRAKAGDGAAREQLINLLLPLVSSYARRFPTEGLEETDLLQEGVVGVLRALDRYDPSLGVPFPAFATWWIRRSLQDARSDFMRSFRLPPKALRQLSQLKSEHQRIYQNEHRSATIAELAGKLDLDLAQAEALASADAQVRSLDETLAGGDGDIGSLGDLLADPLSSAAYEEVIDNVAGQQLHALLTRLSEREQAVVRARFGFDGQAERLADIGERLGLSAERVRQIEDRALAKLRHGT